MFWFLSVGSNSKVAFVLQFFPLSSITHLTSGRFNSAIQSGTRSLIPFSSICRILLFFPILLQYSISSQHSHNSKFSSIFTHMYWINHKTADFFQLIARWHDSRNFTGYSNFIFAGDFKLIVVGVRRFYMNKWI